MPKNRIDISIIIPTLNSEQTLNDCLKSIDNVLVNEVEFEVLVMDGGSTDATVSIAQNSLLGKTVQIFSEPDDGIYDAMNKGIKVAMGKWLYFMGSDDILLNGFLDLIREAECRNDDLLYANLKLKNTGTISKGNFDFDRICLHTPPHQATIFLADLFHKYGGYETKYFLCADYERFLYFFSRKEVRKKYIDTNVAIFNEEGISKTRTNDVEFIFDRHHLIKEYFKDHLDVKNLAIKVNEAKRVDAISLIDNNVLFRKSVLMYLSTIRLKDNHLKHVRYILGSTKNYMIKRLLRKKAKNI